MVARGSGLDGSIFSKGIIFLLRQDAVCPTSEAPGYCESQNSVFEDNKLHPHAVGHQISLLLEVCHLIWLNTLLNVIIKAFICPSWCCY